MMIECPNCHKAHLILDEVFDTEWYDEAYVDNCIGHCPECDKKFEWAEKYRFSDYDSLREIND